MPIRVLKCIVLVSVSATLINAEGLPAASPADGDECSALQYQPMLVNAKKCFNRVAAFYGDNNGLICNQSIVDKKCALCLPEKVGSTECAPNGTCNMYFDASYSNISLIHGIVATWGYPEGVIENCYCNSNISVADTCSIGAMPTSNDSSKTWQCGDNGGRVDPHVDGGWVAVDKVVPPPPLPR